MTIWHLPYFEKLFTNSETNWISQDRIAYLWYRLKSNEIKLRIPLKWRIKINILITKVIIKYTFNHLVPQPDHSAIIEIINHLEATISNQLKKLSSKNVNWHIPMHDASRNLEAHQPNNSISSSKPPTTPRVNLSAKV